MMALAKLPHYTSKVIHESMKIILHQKGLPDKLSLEDHLPNT
jgi:hypothetical protein